MAAKATPRTKSGRVLDARPDTVDFRDRMYIPTLIEVPPRIELAEYRACFEADKVPILDQGQEGACTGFGLAAVANYLLRQLYFRKKLADDPGRVSERMLYEMARRYDEWPGEKYEGSSARGAMKGWHKHGVCSARVWPYDAKRPGTFTPQRAGDARLRPLGAYFRVNHKDLVALHAALTEVGILYATADVHSGWDAVDRQGRIPFRNRIEGGHAFAIVAYDRDGFWIQNSWGPSWGQGGFAHLSYDDWLRNGSDVWVARLGAPVELQSAEATATAHGAARQAASYSFVDLRPHIVSIGNNGLLSDTGTFASTPEGIEAIFKEDFPRITRDWKTKRLLLYAHGGLTSDDAAVQRVADYSQALLEAEVYPLAFVWKTDFWSTLTNILRDALRSRRAEGPIDAGKEFLLERLDSTMEVLVSKLRGRIVWDEMKENALLASTAARGGARLVAEQVARLDDVEVHVAGHSAGGVFHAPLVQLLGSKGKIAQGPLAGQKGLGVPIRSCTLWAPACTLELARETYLPLIKGGRIERFALFTLTDEAERSDHCAHIYNKSILYLVSHALEERPPDPVGHGRGVPLLGMQKHIDKSLAQLVGKRPHRWVLAPNAAPEGSAAASRAQQHGDFDDDAVTLKATLATILGKASAPAARRAAAGRRAAAAGSAATNGADTFQFAPTRAGRRDLRLALQRGGDEG